MLYSGFSCQIATDTLIASAMFVLLRRFRTGLRRYAFASGSYCPAYILLSLDLVITMIVMYTVNTGILTMCVCSSFLLEFSLTYSNLDWELLYVSPS